MNSPSPVVAIANLKPIAIRAKPLVSDGEYIVLGQIARAHGLVVKDPALSVRKAEQIVIAQLMRSEERLRFAGAARCAIKVIGRAARENERKRSSGTGAAINEVEIQVRRPALKRRFAAQSNKRNRLNNGRRSKLAAGSSASAKAWSDDWRKRKSGSATNCAGPKSVVKVKELRPCDARWRRCSEQQKIRCVD
jgi:hypothetical protein